MRLMISVLSRAEAHEAMAGGADILDVKNPAEGSLGAQPPHVIRKIKDLAYGKIEISAAIGDMPNLPGTAALAALGAAVCGADYIKVGLRGPQTEAEAVVLLREVRQAVSEFQMSVVAAAYADFQRAGTIDPRSLPDLSVSAGVQGCLLDTAIKDGQPLFAFIAPQSLRVLAEQAHEAGLFFGVAGALRGEHLKLVRDIGADIAGLRSAVCRHQMRSGPLDAAQIRQLRRILVPVV